MLNIYFPSQLLEIVSKFETIKVLIKNIFTCKVFNIMKSTVVGKTLIAIKNNIILFYYVSQNMMQIKWCI